MARKEFDVDELAAYLHLTPQQVERLASRGKVPGRKVAGQWRFAEAEIHHWLEERIGLLDEDELDDVEGVLKRSAERAGEGPLRLANLFSTDAIQPQLRSRSRGKVVAEMCQLAAATGILWDPDKVEEAVLAREDLQPTALDNGVALLHPRRPLPSILAEAMVALGRSGQGIPFGGGRQLTDLFFLILSTDDRTHLRTLAKLSRLIAQDEFLAALRAAEDAAAIKQVIEDFETQLEQ